MSRPTPPRRRPDTARPADQEPPARPVGPPAAGEARTPAPRRRRPATARRPAPAARPAARTGPPERSQRAERVERRPRSETRIADLAVARSARRWRPGRRSALVAGVLLVLVVAAGWVLLASPWLRVESVQVSGTRLTDPAEVEQLARPSIGRPMAAAGTGDVERAVAALPFVADVDVVRHWPHELRLEITERSGIAAVPAAAGGVDLVDADGVVRLHTGTPPPGVPLLGVDVASAGVAALEAAREVNAELPDGLRAQVAEITAASPSDVRLRLTQGPEVVWGDSGRPERKAEVLLRLLAEPDAGGAERIDVSAPDAPAVDR